MSHYNEGSPSLETWVEPTLIQSTLGLDVEHDEPGLIFDNGRLSAVTKETLAKRSAIAIPLSAVVIKTAQLKGWL